MLKSSLKYSKPPCLANLGGGLNNTTLNRSGAQGLNRSVHVHQDHDDLRNKLEHLMKKFVEKHKDKDSFKDTFFDEEILQEITDSRNYFKLALDLLKYTLHSNNLPKKKKDDGKKKTGMGGFSSRT